MSTPENELHLQLAPPSLERLRARAAITRSARSFFQDRGYLEVETPILTPAAALEPHLVSFRTELVSPRGHNQPLFMHTSPEYAMKRVLAAHATHIFQIARVFRNEEGSRTHHHEFSLIEWYRCHQDYRYLMDETEALVRHLAREHAPAWPHLRRGARKVRVDQPFERLTLREAFLRYADLDWTRCHDDAAMQEATRAAGCSVDGSWSWEDCFHLVLLERVEPHLGVERPTLLYDYPERLAALARCRDAGGYRVAERFELYACDLELCNGFSELTDGAEQRRRFEAEQRLRAELGRPVHALDEAFLAAVDDMPPCTGNALGLDRLVMLLLEVEDIHDVIVT